MPPARKIIIKITITDKNVETEMFNSSGKLSKIIIEKLVKHIKRRE